MKYIINNSKLSELMSKYLDDTLSNGIKFSESYIIIWGEGEREGEDFDNVFFEYDKSDGRLYIYKGFFEKFKSWFSFDITYLEEFIKSWFESKFNVTINFIVVGN